MGRLTASSLGVRQLRPCRAVRAGFVVTGCAFVLPGAALAKPDCGSPEAVRFDPGRSEATVTGGLVRYEDACYRLEARAGQHLQVSIRSPDQNVVFSLYRPGWKVVAGGADGPDIRGVTVRGAGDEDDARSLRTTLAASGSYLLDLGLLRGGGGEYSLVVSITK